VSSHRKAGRNTEREREVRYRNISVIFLEICLETIDRFVERRYSFCIKQRVRFRRNKRPRRRRLGSCRFWISNSSSKPLFTHLSSPCSSRSSLSLFQDFLHINLDLQHDSMRHARSSFRNCPLYTFLTAH